MTNIVCKRLGFFKLKVLKLFYKAFQHTYLDNRSSCTRPVDNFPIINCPALFNEIPELDILRCNLIFEL